MAKIHRSASRAGPGRTPSDEWLDSADWEHDAERRAELARNAVSRAEDSLHQSDLQLWARYSATGKLARELTAYTERISSGAWCPDDNELACYMNQAAANSQPLLVRRTRWDWIAAK